MASPTGPKSFPNPAPRRLSDPHAPRARLHAAARTAPVLAAGRASVLRRRLTLSEGLQTRACFQPPRVNSQSVNTPTEVSETNTAQNTPVA